MLKYLLEFCGQNKKRASKEEYHEGTGANPIKEIMSFKKTKLVLISLTSHYII